MSSKEALDSWKTGRTNPSDLQPIEEPEAGGFVLRPLGSDSVVLLSPEMFKIASI